MDKITKVTVTTADGIEHSWEGAGGVLVTSTITPSATGETNPKLGATEISFVQAQLLIAES